MFSTKINLYKPFSRLVKKNQLLTLDVVYQGKPFVNVVSSNQNNYNLDTVYNGQPFVGTPNNYIKRSPLLGINHPDVEMWLNTVSLNNGSASSTTISALNTFCNSIDSAGLRSKFYRLNLFCGNNLNSCLVPLYVSRIWHETAYGFYIDQNLNFTNADYNETGLVSGLTGNGSNTYLDTGIGTQILPISTFGISLGVSLLSTTITSGSVRSGLGVIDNTGFGYFMGIDFRNNPATFTIGSGFGTFTANASFPNLYVCSLLGTNSTGLLRIGSNTFSSSTTATSANPTGSERIYVMARNSGNSSPAQYWGGRSGGYFIGQHITQAESATVLSAINIFQATIGR